MKPQICLFVSASKIFDGLGLAWDVFINGEPKCSWGENKRSMVTAAFMVKELEKSDMNVGPESKQVGLAVTRLAELPNDVLVDLES